MSPRNRRSPSYRLHKPSGQRYAMDLVLEFADGAISGFGDDCVGEFTIRGSYDTNSARCSWHKQYLGQHVVVYTGQARQRGVIGEWRIPGDSASWTGPFFIWPRAFGDLGSGFERAFLEYELELSPGIVTPELIEV